MTESKQKGLTRISRDRGMNVIILDDHKQMSTNLQYYRGAIDKFHKHTVKNVKGKAVEIERVSTQITKRVAEDFTSLLFNEDSRIFYDGDYDKKLQEALEDNRFGHRFSHFLETTYGVLGNGYAAIYHKDGAPKIDLINGNDVYITHHDNGETYGVVVVNEKTAGKNDYTQVTFHTYIGNKYRVEHAFYENGQKTTNAEKDIGSPMSNTQKIAEVFDLDEDSLNRISTTDDAGDIKFIWETITDYKYFVHFKPNIKNNHDINSPYGVGIISNSRDLIRSLDKIYTDSVEEYDNGQSRIIVNTSMLEKKIIPREDGSTDSIDIFDPDKKVYTAMPMGDEGKPIEIFSPILREEQYERGISRILSHIGFNAGFGTNYYRFENGSVATTATQVKMNKSDMWRNIRKHQNLLKEQLFELVAGILDAMDLDFDPQKIMIEFDDSIIIDDEKEYEKDMQLVDKGMMTKKEFLVKHKKITEQEAEEKIKQAQEEDQQEQSSLFGIGD